MLHTNGLFVEFGGYEEAGKKDPGNRDATKQGAMAPINVAPRDVEATIDGVKNAPIAKALEVAEAGKTVKIEKATVEACTDKTLKKGVTIEALDRKTYTATADTVLDIAAKKKTYRYHIHMGEISDVFERKYEYQYEKTLDVERMKEAASYLIGTHDFTSFCGNKKMKKTAVRTIYEINFTKKGNDLWIDYRGNGFLQNMVRILTGTLIEVGDGRRAPEELPQILESKNRENAGYTAPACGLMLMEVHY